MGLEKDFGSQVCYHIDLQRIITLIQGHCLHFTNMQSYGKVSARLGQRNILSSPKIDFLWALVNKRERDCY